MAKAFNVELSMPEGPAEAQARAATALVRPARAVGLRLKERRAGELVYGPPITFPLLLSLWRHIDRHRMQVNFEADGGGTRVTISGAVSGRSRELAANEQHWSEALGGSA